MATTAEIIEAIDTAILAGISGPGELRFADGRAIGYRSLIELKDLRAYYAKLYRGGNSTVRLGDMNV